MPPDSFHRRRVLFLGAETSCHVTRWVRRLRRDGHEVVFATLHPEPGGSALRLVGRAENRATTPAALLRASRRLRLVARNVRPDVTIAYYLTSYGLLARLAHLRPCVGVAAGGDILVDPFDGPLHRARNALAARVALSGFDGLCAWGEHVADRAAVLGFARERTFVLPRGVDRTLFPYREPRPVGDSGPLRILSTRWFKPLYLVDSLVRALSLLRDRGVAFEARLFGGGPEEGHLRQLASSLGLGPDHLTICGMLPADDMPSAMAWADVYVSTSCSDGASSSLFEALSTGLYPIVTDIPANRFVLAYTGVGMLFRTGDSAGLAECLVQAATHRRGMVRDIEATRAAVAAHLDYSTNMTRINAFVLSHALPSRAPERASMSVSGP